MAYTKKIWKDYPDTATPIKADDLNNIEDALAGMLDYFYPVGTIYETTSANLDTITKMANHFGGTWEVYGAGRVTVGLDSSDTDFDTVGETRGAKTHTLQINEIPSHTHNIETGLTEQSYEGIYPSFVTNARLAYYIYNGATATGGGEAHNNLQPYIVVYRYRRTA